MTRRKTRKKLSSVEASGNGTSPVQGSASRCPRCAVGLLDPWYDGDFLCACCGYIKYAEPPGELDPLDFTDVYGDDMKAKRRRGRPRGFIQHGPLRDT